MFNIVADDSDYLTDFRGHRGTCFDKSNILNLPVKIAI